MRKAVNGRQNARSNIPFFEQGKYTSTFGQSKPTLRDDSEEIELWEDQNMSKTSDDELTQFDKAQIGNEGEDPYRILDTGRKVYLDELDVLTLLDPPSFLIPMDANDYNQAAFLWKKIGDIPEERRHRLLSLLTSKQIANMWEITGEMYESSDFPPPDSGTFLLGSDSESLLKPVSWTGKLADVPWPLSSFNRFKKIFFLGTDGSVYGRVITGGWLLQHVTRWILPLYFEVRDVRKVNATEDPCNIALEYGEGQLHLDIPQGFPNPAKHPWPFKDSSFDYIRPVGPGVFVGQWWHEGRHLEKVPQNYGNFVMIKDYLSNSPK